MDLLKSLAAFEFIPLEQLSAESVIKERTDTKYLFHESKLTEILTALQKSYLLVHIEGRRVNRYQSIYYDTPDFLLYRQHQRGKLIRYKIRLRSYLDNDIHFLELKTKTNKNRTMKVRLKQTRPEELDATQCSALQPYLKDVSAESLAPKLRINFSRIALSSADRRERLTIDLDIVYTAVSGETASLNHLVVAELKLQDRMQGSVFEHLMKQMSIGSSPFSKYCMGIATLNPDIKKNNFKPIIRQMEHLMQNQH